MASEVPATIPTGNSPAVATALAATRRRRMQAVASAAAQMARGKTANNNQATSLHKVLVKMIPIILTQQRAAALGATAVADNAAGRRTHKVRDNQATSRVDLPAAEIAAHLATANNPAMH
jgi:flagellar hook-basal body complex protein FliE